MNSADKAKHIDIVSISPIKRIFLGAVILLLCGGIAFSIKPIRRVVVTYTIKLLSYLDHSKMDETPNISKDQLSVQIIEGRQKDDEYEYIKKQDADIYTGDLILVNSSNAYKFTMQDELISLNKHKNKSYKLLDKKMQLSRRTVYALNKMMTDFEQVSGKHDMIITSAYRSLLEQNEAFKEKANEFGEEDALKWAMLPGYSEHHTGYAVDMSIRTDDDVYITYKGQSEYAWINQNCFKYGIVRRYTEEKVDVTGISNEPWHYRYVGIPHAYLMTIHQMCLEEYIDYIKHFTFDKEHLLVTAEGESYEIYFVPAEQGETLVPVPRGEAYSISGNNIDGFIVTYHVHEQ